MSTNCPAHQKFGDESKQTAHHNTLV